MNARVRRLLDGVVFQALITGSLSFAHIHDLATRYGQTGWKAWTYPLSVDLLSVAAYRKMRRDRAEGNPVLLPWVCFLMALGASLAANVIATGGHDPMSIAVGVWPALAFLGCTLLGHAETAPAIAGPVESEDHGPSRTTIERTTVDRLTVETPAVVAEPGPVPIAATVIASTPALPAPPPAALPPVNPDLLEIASRVAAEHAGRHDAPITVPDLQRRLNVNAALASNLHAHLTAATAA